MNIITQIINNKCLIIPLAVWFFIQIFKFITDFIINKKINLKRLMGAGGMPSSHSAVMCSLASCVGKAYGFDSGAFAIAIIVAFVVMYDAAGVRRAAGKQAKLLNKIVETPGLTGVQVQEKLVEVLGHSPKEVLVGALIGIIVGLIF